MTDRRTEHITITPLADDVRLQIASRGGDVAAVMEYLCTFLAAPEGPSLACDAPRELDTIVVDRSRVRVLAQLLAADGGAAVHPNGSMSLVTIMNTSPASAVTPTAHFIAEPNRLSAATPGAMMSQSAVTAPATDAAASYNSFAATVEATTVRGRITAVAQVQIGSQAVDAWTPPEAVNEFEVYFDANCPWRTNAGRLFGLANERSLAAPVLVCVDTARDVPVLLEVIPRAMVAALPAGQQLALREALGVRHPAVAQLLEVIDDPAQPHVFAVWDHSRDSRPLAVSAAAAPPPAATAGGEAGSERVFTLDAELADASAQVLAMVLCDIAAGLAHCHALGYVHGSITPAALQFYTERGREPTKPTWVRGILFGMLSSPHGTTTAAAADGASHQLLLSEGAIIPANFRLPSQTMLLSVSQRHFAVGKGDSSRRLSPRLGPESAVGSFCAHARCEDHESPRERLLRAAMFDSTTAEDLLVLHDRLEVGPAKAVPSEGGHDDSEPGGALTSPDLIIHHVRPTEYVECLTPQQDLRDLAAAMYGIVFGRHATTPVAFPVESTTVRHLRKWRTVLAPILRAADDAIDASPPGREITTCADLAASIKVAFNV